MFNKNLKELSDWIFSGLFFLLLFSFALYQIIDAFIQKEIPSKIYITILILCGGFLYFCYAMFKIRLIEKERANPLARQKYPDPTPEQIAEAEAFLEEIINEEKSEKTLQKNILSDSVGFYFIRWDHFYVF